MFAPASIADLRRNYSLAGLRRADLAPDPLTQFHTWFAAALDGGVLEPNAMTLATVDAAGQPSSRIVLLKAADDRGFVFFTNYAGRKGRELADNPRAALTFFWPQLERQICIAGTVTKVSRDESANYFQSRPFGSRLASWASRQSEPIADQALLHERLAAVRAQYDGAEVPLPPYWGGYALTPHRVEFWQGRPDRLHDRLQYERDAAGGWEITRLSP